MLHFSDKKIAVFGSTGSVGCQTLEVARRHGIRVTALAAGANVKLLEEQIREFRPACVAVMNEEAAAALKLAVADLIPETKITVGRESVLELAERCDADMVFNAVSGVAGLRPTLAAIAGGHDVALANKETLVTAGDYVFACAKEKGVRILPVDSEHCAIFQCLSDHRACGNAVSRLILTASGGAFYGKKRSELSHMTPEEALCHPTWQMGRKITLDSATLANKGLEVIEAARLFGVDADHIDVVIHRESIVHSMVEYVDHAVVAQLAVPDMRLCIQYALTYPERQPGLTPPIDFTKIGKLSFEAPDMETFSLLKTAYAALRCGGTLPAVFNAANEVAAALFFAHKISFTDIFDLVNDVVCRWSDRCGETPTADEAEAADQKARQSACELANVEFRM